MVSPMGQSAVAMSSKRGIRVLMSVKSISFILLFISTFSLCNKFFSFFFDLLFSPNEKIHLLSSFRNTQQPKFFHPCISIALKYKYAFYFLSR